MWVLVDYANISELDKNRGLDYVVESLLNRIGPKFFAKNQQITVRLYDGWYERNTLTRNAQRIVSQIEEFSPSPISIRRTPQPFFVRVSVELARSLISSPSKDILHTYRSRGFPTGLDCKPPPFDGCANQSNCPWIKLPEFLVQRQCPEIDCSLHPKKIIYRAEQKIVDTMLTTDLLELCLRKENVAIVSSDDDMLPGMSLALSRGSSIIHVETKPKRFTMHQYFDEFLGRYTNIEAR